MSTVSIDIPQEVADALAIAPERLESEVRLLLALKLYETDRLSSGLAAKVAGIPRSTFLVLMGRYGISPFGHDADALEQDLENTRQARHRE